ncbi:formate dehydrogenase subunit gamma [Salipiger sp. IMCC34102]|uniref:formate dehydrogenase subunit gamma n=1 Tax=Salipiger sp. IMCC34102 TaxID=2510647 RepID=UPI00101B8D16|nr:formate dehydrogenase subunit gamma [Salipiger sp. IMCC34102]RYH03487.1 formate dehydrogenase subunit gamma [Salipiger sp. IMCC34102]
MLRPIAAALLALALTGPAAAQYVDPDVTAAPMGSVPAVPETERAPALTPDQESTRASTGGAPTLTDILRRQKGLPVDDSDRRADTAFQDDDLATGAMGPQGNFSDAQMWRALRYDSADITTVNNGPAATTVIQDGGMTWLNWRSGPLRIFAGIALLGSLALLIAFYLFRGRMRLDHPPTGRRIVRFEAFERFGHWLLATSFIILAVTGLLSLFGRLFFIPLFGKQAFAPVAGAAKWTHDNISWAFMISLVLIFVFWVRNNLPDRTDLTWLKRAGGMFGGGHPPAKKFNAGQKLIFWAVIVFGTTISLSGLSLLFPFELNLFGKTFGFINDTGILQALNLPALPGDLSPQAEMALSQIWHATMSIILTAIIFFHIYLGTVGMEGAFDAMGKGDVDEEWAREHHNLWLQKVAAEKPEKIKEYRA